MNRFTNHRIVNSAVSSASSGTLLSGMCKRLAISSTKDAYVSFNTDTAVSSSNGYFIKGGSEYTFDLTKVSRFNAIRDSEDGRLSVLELF